MRHMDGFLATSLLVALLTSSVVAAEPPAPADDPTFRAFLDRVDVAQAEFAQGRPEAFKALWSRRPDITLFGGFGSGETGWAAIGPRLDWASAQFSKGTRTHEVLSRNVHGDLGTVVQRETIRYAVPGHDEDAVLELRATMIVRREDGQWRLVHRHADAQVAKTR